LSDEVAEEAADEQQRADPDDRAAGVEDQEAAQLHAGLAGDRRRDDGEAGDELGEEQRVGAALAEGVMGAADAVVDSSENLQSRRRTTCRSGGRRGTSSGRRQAGQRPASSAAGKFMCSVAESAPAASRIGVAGRGRPICSSNTQPKIRK
jgi:hypothetical protein